MQNLKKMYSYKLLYISFVRAYRSFLTMMSNFIHKSVDSKLIERLMLATTEVNGCAACSYAHTRLALLEGFSQDEINAFLSGSDAYTKPEEATAILYAQHVADTMGQPDTEVKRVLIERYGVKEAKIIRSVINIIMMGNISGIPLSAFLYRLKGRPYANSSLNYELGMLLALPLFALLALPHAVLDCLSLKQYEV